MSDISIRLRELRAAGYPNLPAVLRPHQEEAIQNVTGGFHTVLHLPTNAGKTLPQIITCLFGKGGKPKSNSKA
jgi:Lhr-like helicase